MTRALRFAVLAATVLLALMVGSAVGYRVAAPRTVYIYLPWPAPSGTLSVYEPLVSGPDRRPSIPPPPPVRPAAGQALRGIAAVHATGRDGLYAAAGPALRAALGRHWRGMRVAVTWRGRTIRVTLNDFCRCDTVRPWKLLDLSDEAWARLTGRPWSVVRVVVTS